MKFGDSIYRLSVPKWAAYNLNYNELKRLIKHRTTAGAAAPVPIPGQTDHRWSALEDELYGILKEQYENIALFVRSKHGEIERRLTHLDKSLRSARRTANLYSGRPSAQARKYQKLIEEAENIGDVIQSLSRYASVQRTAFRKILKKYRKWTGSDTLRKRLDNEVFNDGQLSVNLTDQMQQLTAQTATLQTLQDRLLNPDQDQGLVRTVSADSPANQISKASSAGILHFDAAFVSTPFGEAAGTATYWIHPDNLQEARILLFKYTRELEAQAVLSRANSVDSLLSQDSAGSSLVNHTAACFFDNAQRYMQDRRTHSPSKVALTARWNAGLKESLITISDMSPRSDYNSTVAVKKKELSSILDRQCSPPPAKTASAANVRIIKDYLSQHRDVMPLAMVTSARTRYIGHNNSTEVGTFATLDTNVSFSKYNEAEIMRLQSNVQREYTFPHAVLDIRWEFGRKPEIVRAFDSTHLAERVPDFTIESAAILTQNPELGNATWSSILEGDIRKVPVHTKPATRRQDIPIGSSSGPSSTEGAPSVFSLVAGTGASDSSPMQSSRDLTASTPTEPPTSKSKKARIAPSNPKRPEARYYSEYDDPDSEINQQEAYTIFVDPDEEPFGMAAFRSIGAKFSSLFGTLRSTSTTSKERQPLLGRNDNSHDEDGQSSDEGEGSEETILPKHRGIPGYVRPSERYKQRLSRRQREYEKTITLFYSGLIGVSYILLLMSGFLLATGRRKEVLEVDVGATVGVSVALLCMFVSIFLVYMRKSKLSAMERLGLILAEALVILLGAGMIVGIVQRATNYRH